MAVYCAEVDNVAGIGIAQHAFVLGGEAAGGDDVEEEDLEHVEVTGEVHHGVEFADWIFSLVA